MFFAMRQYRMDLISYPRQDTEKARVILCLPGTQKGMLPAYLTLKGRSILPMSTSVLHMPRTSPVTVRKDRLLPAAAVGAALLAASLAHGRPLWQAAVFSFAFFLLLPLQIRWGERTGRWCARAAFACGPLLAFCLVEWMNYNDLLTDITPFQAVLNLAWYYLIAGAVYLLAGRLVLSAGISTVLLVLIGVANRYVIRFRGRTVFPGDLLTLRTAFNVAGNYDYRLDGVQFVSLLFLGLFCLALWKLPHRKGRVRPRLRAVLPAAGAAALYIAVFFGTDFLSAAGIEPSMWTTRGNGFFLNFMVCLRYSRVEVPEGYSQEALGTILGEVDEAAAALLPAEETVQPVNVIVVMNESLSDLNTALDITTNRDPMPFIRGLTENTVRGTAYSSVFGGTTANSEYEFLTGNTNAFLPDGTVPFHLYVTEGAPNLGGQLGSLGYRTVFMHPYLSSGWNRRSVYRNFGFDEIYFQSDFTGVDYIREYISDRSNYENLIRRYEAKEEGERLFIFNVTMQNHSAYSGAWTNLDKEVWLTGELEGRFNTVDQYLNLVYQSDQAFQYLVEYFAQVEEPTMILLFGDHQPQVATNFYTDVMGGEFEELPAQVQQTKQEVPFLIWANYDIPEAAGIQLSLNYLSSLLLKTAGLPRTGYQVFLEEIHDVLPVINDVGFQDGGGNWYQDGEELPEPARTAMEQYEMLQYNMLFDTEENRLDDFFYLPEQTE